MSGSIIRSRFERLRSIKPDTMPSLDWIQELKVTDLKEELKNRGQPVAGKKAELIARLEAYVKENEVRFDLEYF